MNEKSIVLIETYKKLFFLKKQYFGLPHKDFICDGAEYIWKLQVNIIEKLINRFEKYSNKQLQLINTLFPFFEKICGYLDDSKTKNVPWSIIPSLETLFSEIRPDTKFIICPLWETNYKIFNRNIIEYIDETVLSVPGLLFDSSDDFDANKNKFLEEYPSGIYFVFYPRTERLSVLHFPLLGHEIGHIYASIWLDEYFEKLLKESDIEETLKKEVKTEFSKNAINGPLFLDHIIDVRVFEILKIYKQIFAETISDIVGAFIFGPSTLFSSYIFALKFGLDDFKGFTDGYLPWRFRLNLICRALDYMKIGNLPDSHKQANVWISNICKTAIIDFKSFSYKVQYKYCAYVIDLIIRNFSEICCNIEKFISDQNYKNSYDEKHQGTVVERLENGIIPNCRIDGDLREDPICLRNIVAGTWIYLCELDMGNYDKYLTDSINANLLSLKAIELSHFQNEFNKRI